MNKLDLAKRIGKALAKAAGVAGADDRSKRLEAEKEVVEIKLIVAVAALRDLMATAESVSSGTVFDGLRLKAAVDEARESLEIVDRVE